MSGADTWGGVMTDLTKGRSSYRLINSYERGELGFWPTVVSGVVGGVVATLLVTALLTNEQIERRTADRFLRQYYGQVVRTADRDRTWNMLTAEFRNSGKIREGTLEGRTAYDTFFNKWREVRLGQVDKVAEEPNQFEVDLTYISKTGRAYRPENIKFRLACSQWINKTPLLNCKPKDLKIDDTTYGR
jgi:hypothetical protein